MNGWLTFTRREGESIKIGDDIEVKVSRIHGGKVQLSTRAPASVAVHRSEVAERIELEKATEER